MVYIRSASSISVQQPGGTVQPVAFPAAVVEPDYKALISPAMLRRMAPIIKFSVAAGMDCLKQAGLDKPNAVVTGTGLGCLRDTQKFMEAFLTSDADTLSPTAFIQSTHNTISGQIALMTTCHGYNMTFVQNNLSFEYALLDSKMLIDEGADNVLVGAADERIEILNELASKMQLSESFNNKISEGAAFFLLSNNSDNALAKLLDVHAETREDLQVEDTVNTFLKKHGLIQADIDCLVYGITDYSDSNAAINFWLGPKINFIDYFGYFFTNSALGLHIATDALQGKYPQGFGLEEKPKRILVLNQYQNKSLGLMLIQQP